MSERGVENDVRVSLYPVIISGLILPHFNIWPDFLTAYRTSFFNCRDRLNSSTGLQEVAHDNGRCYPLLKSL